MMPEAVTIRAAGPADIDTIADIFTRAHRTLTFLPALHSAEEDRAHWRDNLIVDCEIFVAESEATIVGIMAVCDNFIAQLQVDPDHPRQGIGSALVRHAQTLRSELHLWCFQQNAAARALYEKHGFVAELFTNGDANEEKTPDVRYGWTV